MDFKSFRSIEALHKAVMVITQKIHGSNAQVCIFEYSSTDHVSHEPRLGIKAGSRNRWLSLEDDNYGFAAWVEKNRDELIAKLGLGTHYGEWAGPGINSGEGLKEKTLVLFNWWSYEDGNLPAGTMKVPVLYSGHLDTAKIDEAMADLKQNGSRLVPGFMRPEGVVVTVGGAMFKKVFEPEETQWRPRQKEKKEQYKRSPKVDYTHLCQPIRLEKLLSRDEALVRGYPGTLAEITKYYVADLIKEGEIVGDKDQVSAITKAASGQVFVFIKTFMTEGATAGETEEQETQEN